MSPTTLPTNTTITTLTTSTRITTTAASFTTSHSIYNTLIVSADDDAALNADNAGEIISVYVETFIFSLCTILVLIIYYFYCNKVKNDNKKTEHKVQSVHPPVMQSANIDTVIKSDQNEGDVLPFGGSKMDDDDGRIYYENNGGTDNDNNDSNKTKSDICKSTVTVLTNGWSLDQATSIVDGVDNSIQVSMPPFNTEEGEGSNVKEMVTGGDNDNNDHLTISNNNKYKDIKNFFEDVKIMQDFKNTYFQLFIENGFDTLESITTLSNQDLIDIGIDKIGHRRMVLSKAQQL